MRKVRVYRAGCSNNSLVFYVNFFIDLLKKKYEVIIDHENPEIVFYANQFTIRENIDEWSNLPAKWTEDFPNAKKIFISGEHVHDYSWHVNNDKNHFTIGSPHSLESENSLNCPSLALASIWQLHHDCGFFNDENSWLTEKRNPTEIFSQKKHFCGIVQNATNAYRKELYDKLSMIGYIKACGAFATTVSNEECIFAVHNETIDIRNKVNFFKDCHFSLNIQYEDVPGFTPDKIFQAFAANTIPVFYGNSLVEQDGYNPDSFINCHKFNSIDDVVEEIKSIYSDEKRLLKMYSQPIFIDNKIPEYYNTERVLSFLQKIVET